jgi:1,4-alpha-glucan branching enzyme
MSRCHSDRASGELAIVLHTHMPYVEGFGTWPFGEEWLWEAVATSFVPLLDLLEPRHPAPVTLSLTPVLCDQLEAPGALERCLRFLREVRPESHRRDVDALHAEGRTELVPELERSASEYAAAAERLAALPTGLLGALAPYARWTSAATHAVLPLVASDSLIAVQVQTGIASHRRRFGEWAGGFWLPECAHAPWLGQPLEEAGVRATCVELTGVFGLGDPRHLEPVATVDGPVLWPVDRSIMSLVWSEHGYPSGSAYRNYHGLTRHHHRLWRNDGAAYDPAAADALVNEHARDFVARVQERVRDGGVCVCALDTELLGHWWYEGSRWLAAVLDEAARQGLRLTDLDDALERHEPAPTAAMELGVSSWGAGGDLRTWSGPAVADLAWQARTAELELLSIGRRPPDRALRELVALQSSDWAFMAARGSAGEYPRERARGHAEALRRALAAGATAAEPAAGATAAEPALRNLAPDLCGWVD